MRLPEHVPYSAIGRRVKAALVTAAGIPPAYADAPEPSGPGERITVTAAALSQLARARASGTHYSAGGAFPFCAGVDGVGRTDAGARVYFLLPDPPQGAMAERVVVPADRTVALPDGLDDVTAAAIANPAMSSAVALGQRARLAPGETVLVHGATGASGRLAVRLARHGGAARVIATGRNRAVLDDLAADGAHTIALDDSAAAEFAAVFADGVDVVLDYLWGPVTEPVIAAAAQHGPKGRAIRWVQIGSMGGATLAMPAAPLRSSGLVLMGSGLGSVSNVGLLDGIAQAFAAAGPAGLALPTRTFPLSEVAAAWAAPDDGRRVVLLPGG